MAKDRWHVWHLPSPSSVSTSHHASLPKILLHVGGFFNTQFGVFLHWPHEKKNEKRCTRTSGGGAYCEDKKQNCSPCLFQRTLPLPNPSSFLNTSSPCCQLCLFCFSPMVPQTPLVKCQPVCQLADSALDAKHLLGEDFPHKYCMCPDFVAFVAERNTHNVSQNSKKWRIE